MSRFNEYTTFMEEALDYIYQQLPYHALQRIYATDSITKELQQSWYKLSYHKKEKIYENIIVSLQCNDVRSTTSENI
jgi:hypothetical protein